MIAGAVRRADELQPGAFFLDTPFFLLRLTGKSREKLYKVSALFLCITL